MLYTTETIDIDLSKNGAYLLYDSNKVSSALDRQLLLYARNWSNKSNEIKLLINNLLTSTTIERYSTSQLITWFRINDDVKSIWIISQRKCHVIGYWSITREE
jgi:hypothetical protein